MGCLHLVLPPHHYHLYTLRRALRDFFFLGNLKNGPPVRKKGSLVPEWWNGFCAGEKQLVKAVSGDDSSILVQSLTNKKEFRGLDPRCFRALAVAIVAQTRG